ncbi:MAG: tetratricopeptide repeat protein [Rhodothermales bacterium]|nr:tetratricopeptide repeat protein [Rhodothermales bacterium]MBO6780513.1 tetratricopeptide repeat protein [Rhodothermales bacterium]
MRSRALGIGLVLVVSVSLAGCKSSSFVGKRYDNFTAYYNTFYNAKRSFRDGVNNRQRTNEEVDRTRYMGVFTESDAAGGGREFEEAVLKSADVLREHPDSKWVDDALLLIGKSYFFQKNYVGAEQKFREAIDLETGLEDEARFWLARTFVASGDFDQAETTIGEALAGEIDREWRAPLRLALGELRVKQADWEAAAQELAAGLEVVRDNETGARAAFLLGQVLETLERWDDAVQAYRRTLDYRPHYELSYAAQYSAIRLEGQHGDRAEALRLLRRMERDDKHFSYRAELAVLRADILRAGGLADEAFNVYDELLYDPVFASEVSSLRGRIHYALGELYRDLDENYVMAAAHFDTAASGLRIGVPQPGASTAPDQTMLAPEAIEDAQELKEAFGAYAGAFREVDRLDSLLWLGQMDDSTFAAKVLELRRARAEELAERQRQQEERQIERAFQQNSGASPLDNRGLPEGKVIPSRNAAGGESGFLFHDDPVMRQEGRLSFARRWGDRPLVPNWRRMEAVAGAQLTGEDGTEEEFEVELAEDQLPEVDVSAVPRDSLSQAEMASALALARYDVGTALFLGISRPDSAASWFRMVLEDTPEEEVSRRALYALAEIQRALGDSLAANGIYQQVLDQYPDSEFADRVRELFGVEDDEVVPDSLALAESLYARYFQRWDDEAYREAMNGMVEVAGTYPSTAIVPKALLAAGSIFLEWADRDTLNLRAPLPLTVADSLLARTGVVTPPEPDTMSVPLDSLGQIVPDSLGAVAADSLRTPAEADSLGAALLPGSEDDESASEGLPAAADSLAAQDSTAAGQAELEPVSNDSLTVDLESGAGVASEGGTAASADSLAAAGGALPEGSGAESAQTEAAPTEAAQPEATLAEADTLPVEEPEPVPVEPERAWNELTLKELMAHISQRYAGSDYAQRAGDILGAIEDIEAEEQARIDSIEAAIEQARLDSLAALLPDSSLVAAVPDSLAAPAPAEVPADSLKAATDLEVEVEEAAADTVLVRQVPVGMAGARDAVQGMSTEMRIVETDALQPLEPTEEEEETAWSGWTVALSELRDLAAAPEVRDNLRPILQGQAEPEIWTGAWQDQVGILVTAGRFETRQEAVRFAASLGTNLPLDAFLLHILTPDP